MRRDQLEHLIRAAGQVLNEQEIIVIGSQAILASVPSGLPPEAVRSIEADILPVDDVDEAKADEIDGSLGEGSMFQETHGIYAQGVGQHTARLPEGWQERLISIRNDNTGGINGKCLEAHDICVSKLLAGRPKDLEFCRALISAGVVQRATLLNRLEQTDTTSIETERIVMLINSLAAPPPASRPMENRRPRMDPHSGKPNSGLDLGL
jgi:Nucleotidyltransferase of unknown function (DUF6036)